MMSPDKRPTKPIAVYVRVSRVSGRDMAADASTAAEQERRCLAQLSHDGFKEGEVYTDLDQSGAKASRPAFDEMLASIEQGVHGGVVVYNLRRFGRSTQGVLQGIQWLEEHGSTFISCEERIDTTTPMGRFALTIFAALGELELEERRESWSRSRESAVRRGIFVGSTLPVGYSRDRKTRALVPNEHAPAVREAFEARARGASWSEVAAILTKHNVPSSHRTRGTATGPVLWQPRSAAKLCENRTYRGEVRSGQYVQANAHEPIIPSGLWARVQKRKREAGSYAVERENAPLLAGIAKCATCGGPLTQDSTVTASGKKHRFYRCRTQARECSARPSITNAKLEEYVTRYMLEHGRIEAPAPAEPSPEYDAALAAVEAAEDRLAEWEISWRKEGVTISQAARMTAQLEEERDAAVEALHALPVRSPDAFWRDARKALEHPLAEGLDKAGIIEGARELFAEAQNDGVGGQLLWGVWQLADARRKREIVKSIIREVTVKPGRLPVGERVAVQLRTD